MFQPPVSVKARLFAQTSRLLLHSFLLSPEEQDRLTRHALAAQGIVFDRLSSR